MKKILIPIAIVAALAFTSRISSSETAQANKVQGLYIFTDSKPVSDYESIAFLKCKVVQYCNNNQYGEVSYIQLREDLLKQAKKKYPDATGIIIDADNLRGEVIRLK